MFLLLKTWFMGSKKTIKLILIAIVILILSASQFWVYSKGKKSCEKKWDKEKAELSELIREEEKKLYQQSMEDLAEYYQIEASREKTNTVIKERIKYVESKSSNVNCYSTDGMQLSDEIRQGDMQ